MICTLDAEIKIIETFDKGKSHRQPLYVKVGGVSKPVKTRFIQFSGTFDEVTQFVKDNEHYFQVLTIRSLQDKVVL